MHLQAKRYELYYQREWFNTLFNAIINTDDKMMAFIHSNISLALEKIRVRILNVRSDTKPAGGHKAPIVFPLRMTLGENICLSPVVPTRSSRMTHTHHVFTSHPLSPYYSVFKSFNK